MKNFFIVSVIPVSFLALFLILHFRAREGAAVIIDGRQFSAELATAPAAQEKGLGDRESLCTDCAMLFRFGRKGNYAFWMKDMRFDLDIIWIADGKIVYLAKDVSHKSPDTIDPPSPADNVLEINAGLADRYGFKLGDAVSIK
jgi:uncharacterized membrane protein (UPF0127 family)